MQHLDFVGKEEKVTTRVPHEVLPGVVVHRHAQRPDDLDVGRNAAGQRRDQPREALLLHRHATVTICHSRTRDLAAETSRADVIVAAVGVPGIVTAAMVKVRLWKGCQNSGSAVI